MKITLLLFLAFFVLYFGYRLLAGQKAKPMILEKIEKGAIVLDVRSKAEYQSGAYPGAVHIPVDQLSSRVSELGKDKNRPVVIYCAAGGRAGSAKSLLESVGFTDVTNAGGLNDMPKK